ncbi:MAG: TonB-dependent receptor [Mediterranea sp.]|jgi:TonB-linked SusC/RagA family outer membrane protein|nr:TonB-dependent receptor [Mediterranea sp.]
MKKHFHAKSAYARMLSIFLTVLLTLPLSVAKGETLQQTALQGIVTSATDGEPLIGVSIAVKGSTTGTVTDINGHYTLSVTHGQTLVYSYVGFITQELAYTGQTTLNVSLREDTESLDEVVVVGYGVQKKKLLTGATVQVKGEAIQKLNTTSPLQAMQGQTPGVSITAISGQPDASMKVSIRGVGTTGNASPLYLIDGIGGDITTLNPADIESIDILKDAASAAIYGAQAANGVVLITTKSGKEGKALISFDAYYGIQNIARKPKMLNASQYKTIMDEVSLNSGNAANDWNAMTSAWNEDGSSVDTNWMDAITKDNAKVESYNIGIAGGSATSTYAMSLGYLYQEGLIGGKGVNDMNRYNFRINSEHKLYKNFVKVGERVSIIHKDKNGINDFSDGSGNAMYTYSAIREALGTSPISPIYGKNKYDSPYFSSEYSDWNTGDGNPLGLLLTNKNYTKNWSVDANAYIEINPIKGLQLKSVFGISYGNSDNRYYSPQYSFDVYTDNQHNSVSQTKSDWLTMVWTNTATYQWSIGQHDFNALLGMESSRSDGSWLTGSNQDLKDGFVGWSTAWLSNATTTKNIATGLPNDATRTVSYFGRLGWNWKETYMVNATLRADGSSKFAKGHRFGYFPSISAGWTLTNERFMKPTEQWLNFFKLRASWGQVGNQNIDAFQYVATIASDVYYNNGNLTSNYGTYPSRTANPNLTWETSEQLNIGFDSRLLNNRLGITLDYYIKTTKDWLVQAPTYATTGFDSSLINGGDVRNTGVELALTWNDRIGKDFGYNIGLNGAFNKNKVTSIPTDDGIIHGSGQIISDDSSEIFRAQNGHAMGYYWGYQTAGIFQNQQEIDDWRSAGNGILQGGVVPGDVKYVDLDHNGVIDEKDKTDLGNGMAKFTFGANLGATFKGFDFSVVLNGSAGLKVMQAYRNYTSQKANYTTAILGRWTGEGTSNKLPRMSLKSSRNYEFSDLFLQDGSFLRLSNITLGYDFAKLINCRYIGQARLYAQVQNLCTFTKYDGMDPEVGFGYNSWVSGMDLGSYPRPRTVLFGLNVKF